MHTLEFEADAGVRSVTREPSREIPVAQHPEVSAVTMRYFLQLAALYIGTMLTFNVCAAKLWTLGSFVFTGGIILVPITYIFSDVLTEVYGYARTRQVIWLGFFCNALMILAIQITILLPPAEGWNLQRELTQILETTPRIAVASLSAYLVGEFINSYVMAKLKVLSNGNYLWFRAIASTIVGQFADTAIFITVAFAGSHSNEFLVRAVLSAYVFKVLYEVIAYPVTVRIVRFLKSRENIDVFDRSTDFTPFHWKVAECSSWRDVANGSGLKANQIVMMNISRFE